MSREEALAPEDEMAVEAPSFINVYAARFATG
jgi:hypothetical protein